MKVGTFIGENPGWWQAVPEGARRAEQLGYDFVSCDETLHDSLLTMALAATHTERVELTTAVTLAFPRSPMVLAMQAWDIQQLSRGRLILGLGASLKEHAELRFSVPWVPPAPRMKEYVRCMRAIWDAFQDGRPADFVGKYYRFQFLPKGYNPGPIDFARPKIFLGAIGPAMGRVAGEVADGVIPPGFITERYMREVYLPNIQTGLDRAGRTWDNIEVESGGFAVFGETESEIEQRLAQRRRRFVFEGWRSPYVRRLREEIFLLHGWTETDARLQPLADQGRWEELERGIPEEVLRTIVLTSTYDHLPETLRRHRGYARRTYFGMPTGTPAERERFQHILTELQSLEIPGVSAFLAGR